MLIHIGSHAGRRDKFKNLLHPLIKELTARGYSFERIEALLK
jgi:hypothetical protein